MSAVDVVWLIDADPPGEFGGGRGFYPATGRTDPPDEALMRERFSLIRAMVEGEADGAAVLTLHTSPRFRDTFFAEPYASLWRDFAALGTTLALHPHEDRADGSTLYDDLHHMGRVIAQGCAKARAIGVTTPVFRSGTFAFHPELPALLVRHGFSLDLSAAPGRADPARNADWTALLAPDGESIAGGGARLAEAPLAWNGRGTDLSSDYLYNEKLDLDALVAVYEAQCRASARGGPRVVNFLTHGFGLAEEGWRRQAAAFLAHVRAAGGRVLAAGEATALLASPALTPSPV